MKVFRLALVASLLALLVMPVSAQMDQGQMDQDQMAQQAMNVTVQPGPALRAGLPASADVLINGVVAMRVPASAGGLNPMQRAETIADRLSQAFASGSSWQDTQVLQRNGLWTINVGGNLIATADVNSARAYGIQTGQLASRWARQSVIAMGGQPQLIAQQLQPITTAVAGAQQEFGANWMTSPVRSVAAVNVADGQSVGNVVVAGPQNSLNSVNRVGVFAYSVGNANVYTFVPTTSTSVNVGTMPRATGVGVVSIPADLISTGVMTGSSALQEINAMSASQWNALINDQLAGWRVPFNASTKVVPLYSTDRNEIVGAVQIVGTSNAVAQAQAATATMVGDSVRLSVTSTPASAISGRQPSMLNNAVVSAVIVFPDGESFTSPMEMMPGTPSDTTPPTP